MTPEPSPELDALLARAKRRQPANAANGRVARVEPQTLSAIPATEITMRSIEWLERPLWQRSAFQLLAGPKGSGKGTYLASLAARVSKTANVMFVSSEDSAEIDLVPRLKAAGADLARCFVIEQHVKLPDDVDEIRRLVEQHGGVGLLVIDPLGNHAGATRTNDDGEVRNAIARLNQLADDLGCLLIGVRHPGKDRSRGALASILGSTAWVDTPRAVVVIAPDNDDPAVRHIQVVAGNRSPNGSGRTFRIDAVQVEGLTEPITLAVELGDSQKSVDELLSVPAPSGKGDAIQATLLEALSTGEKSRAYLDQVCHDEHGVDKDSVYRNGLYPLRNQKRVKANKDGLGKWHWQLTGDTE